MNILSRLCLFTAIQGLNNDEKDLIPLIKNQNPHSYCWAYSITSAIELRHALKTGNRLKFNPYGIIDNVLQFYAQFKDQINENQEIKRIYESCKQFGGNDKDGYELYDPSCALLYLFADKKTMIYEYNNKSSNVYLSKMENSNITTLDDLKKALKENKFILAAYHSEPGFHALGPIITNYLTDEKLDLNHNIIITGVGTIEDIPGIFVEIVNSWGTTYYDHESNEYKPLGYDGIYYLKVADNLTSPLINNRRIFTSNFVIDTDEFSSESSKTENSNSDKEVKKFKIISIAVGVIGAIFLVLFIIFLSLYLADNGTKISDITNSSVL
ncbi:hypothetical protein M9Y10_028732 [Tritrichomonas musculus]|uniref:Peptidase C1A papain C-terminal domain-containing protein n=1 Tax=Tritrichomonas musculus TaxID=1915356 RepID=A0ABR2KK57_9EUKA